jgi:hypothetical protein
MPQLTLAQRPAGLSRPTLSCAAANRPRPAAALVGSRRTSVRALGSFDGSYDSDELDYSLARELDSVVDEEKYSKLANKLQKLYDATEVRLTCFPTSSLRLLVRCKPTRKLAGWLKNRRWLKNIW